MVTKQDVAQAKKVFDAAWKKVVQYSEETQHALDMAEKIPARDTSDMYVDKSKSSMKAMNDWSKIAQEASNVLRSYYRQFQPK